MFTIEYRNRVRDYVFERANTDVRVVAGAVVGSLASSEGDRWSDLDLTFGVADGVPIAAVLEDFSAGLVDEFDSTQLFDLPSGAAIYRWQAEYWLSGVRDYALSLACRRRGLPAHYGRGFDALPDTVRQSAIDALVHSLDRDELLRALRCAVGFLLAETEQVQELAARVRPQMEQLSI